MIKSEGKSVLKVEAKQITIRNETQCTEILILKQENSTSGLVGSEEGGRITK